MAKQNPNQTAQPKRNGYTGEVIQTPRSQALLQIVCALVANPSFFPFAHTRDVVLDEANRILELVNDPQS